MVKTAPKKLGIKADTLYVVQHYEGITSHFFSQGALVKTSKFFYPYSSYFEPYIDEETYISKYIDLLLKSEKVLKTGLDIVKINAKDIDFLTTRIAKTRAIVCYLGFYTYGIKDTIANFMPSNPTTNDFLINYACLPNLHPLAVSDAISRDAFFLNINTVFTDNSKIIFTGGRLLYSEDIAYRIYFLASLIKQPGYFEVYVDEGDLFSVESVFNEDSTKHLFSVFNDKSGIECLITNEDGTKQFFDVLPNDVFIVPVEQYTKARLSLKGKQLGLRDITLPASTSDHYLVIDCRNKVDNVETNANRVEPILANIRKLKGSF